MRRAFELALAEEDNKKAEQERLEAYAQSPAGKRNQEAIDSVRQIIKGALAEEDRVMGQQPTRRRKVASIASGKRAKGPQAVKPKRKRKAA
jgi:hypothetical protein